MKSTYELCKLITNLKAEDISPELMEDIRYKTLDWTGCVIGALKKESSKGILSFTADAGGAPQSTAIGLKEKTSMQNAAFSNGIIGHTLEYDDVNKIAITHPGAVVIPAALAVAERYDKNFQQYAMGVIAGYEVMIRLGAALNPSHYDYWHTTGTCGAFAAAAAAAKIMDFTVEQTEQALGIAATMASGLVGVFGTDAKLVNAGNAASNGILAAELVQKGFTAPVGIVEMEKGYAQAASKETDLSFLAAKEGDDLMVWDAYYKIHASCGHTHSALDAVTMLMRDNAFTVEDVISVKVEAYQKAVELTEKFENQSETRAKFSMPYCIATALCFGRVTLREFTPEVRNAPEVLALKNKITVLENPDYTAQYPAKRIESVTITLKDRKISKEVELPLGRPPVEFLQKKFLSLAQMTIESGSAQEILELVLGSKPQERMKDITEKLRRNLLYGK